MQPSPMTPATIAQKFVEARRSATPLADYPGPLPVSLDVAYAVQDAAIELVDSAIVGWKVGRIFPPLSDTYGAERLSGPIFASHVQMENGANVAQIFDGGFGAAEAEFLLRIGHDLPLGKSDYSLEQAAAVVDAVHIGIEIASSPFVGINAHGPTVTASDFGNNNGLIVGAALGDWSSHDFVTWDVKTLVDGVDVGCGKASAFPDGPLGSVRFLLNNLGERGFAVAAGTWISTGAVSGVHAVRVGQRVEAFFGETMALRCTVEAATAA